MTNINNGEVKEEFNVRKCDGYNPANHLVEIAKLDGSGTEMYLKVPERMAWFLQYCAEHKVNGMIDESDIKFIPEVMMFQVTAKVYVNEKVIATGVGGAFCENGKGLPPVQTAATIAKGRALANAGFGTTMCASDEPEETPCESGVPIENPTSAPTKPQNPLVPNTKQTDTQSGASQPTAKPVIPTTLEEARLVKIASGKYQGKNLGDLAALDIKYLKFLVEKYVGSHSEYVEGAKLILASLE